MRAPAPWSHHDWMRSPALRRVSSSDKHKRLMIVHIGTELSGARPPRQVRALRGKRREDCQGGCRADICGPLAVQKPHGIDQPSARASGSPVKRSRSCSEASAEESRDGRPSTGPSRHPEGAIVENTSPLWITFPLALSLACASELPVPAQHMADAESAHRSALELGAATQPAAQLHVKLGGGADGEGKDSHR